MYESITDSILMLKEKDEVVDYWKDKAEIPLFSKKPFDEYDGPIPDSEVLTIKVDTRDAQSRNPFNALVCASTGIGKTRLIKNIVKGFHKQGYSILYFEPKSIEMYNARKKGKGRKIHHLDFNEKLPVVSYTPNFIKQYINKNFPEMLSKLKFYSPDIDVLDYREIWLSFGVPEKAADLIVEMIQKGHRKIDFFIKKILRENLHAMTKQASIASLNNLMGLGFFGTKKRLDLVKEWKKKNIVVVQYFSRDGNMLTTDVGLVLDQVRDVGLEEMKQGLKNISKKLIIFDDAFYYAGSNAMNVKGPNLAIRNISNCQNNFRTWGIDTMFVVQSPDSNAIHPALIDGCTTKLVSYVENPGALSNKLPFNAYRLVANTNPSDPMLFVDEDNYTFQWVYGRGKTMWTTGFPFDCTVGHS